jgi:choline-sulfatase
MPEPKLHPRTGYTLHPWLQQHEDFWSHEATLKDDDERRTAMAAYYGLTSWLDHNVGRLIAALDEAGLSDATRVFYASDHGDNLGARGQWGKSNLYRESVDVPLIIAGPDVRHGTCTTPVSLLDLSVTILDSLDVDATEALPHAEGRSLFDIAGEPENAERLVFSEYHAVGSNTAAYMLRNGRWKYHHYVRHEPELFDLFSDPEETNNLAHDSRYADRLQMMHAELRRRCEPDAIDVLAKADQAALIERLGGIEAVMNMGRAVSGGTPPPDAQRRIT